MAPEALAIPPVVLLVLVDVPRACKNLFMGTERGMLPLLGLPLLATMAFLAPEPGNLPEGPCGCAHVPAGQTLHLVEPALVLTEPAAHLMHFVAEPCWKDPAGHLVHFVEPLFAATEPGAQVVH